MRLALLGLVLALSTPFAGGACADGAQRIAVFDFELINTSPEPTRVDEEARLVMISDLLREQLRAREGYQVVDTAPVAADVSARGPLRACNGCELELAKRLGADLAALGWVQKVSNLILNINLQVREVATGRLARAGTVSIRGNTDESWRRGLLFLLKRRIFKE